MWCISVNVLIFLVVLWSVGHVLVCRKYARSIWGQCDIKLATWSEMFQIKNSYFYLFICWDCFFTFYRKIKCPHLNKMKSLAIIWEKIYPYIFVKNDWYLEYIKNFYSLCLLIVIFGPFTFNVIIGMDVFMSISWVFSVCPICSICSPFFFPLSCFPSD